MLFFQKLTTYPNLNKEPELLKIKTKEDEIKDLKYKTEKHDFENILKSLKIDNEYYEKRYKSLIKENIHDGSRKFNRFWWFRCWYWVDYFWHSSSRNGYRD